MQLFCRMGLTVVGKLAAAVITSSPSKICLSFNFGDLNFNHGNFFCGISYYAPVDHDLISYFDSFGSWYKLHTFLTAGTSCQQP